MAEPCVQRNDMELYNTWGQWDSCLAALAEMKRMKQPINAQHYNAAIKACCKLLRPSDGLALWREMRDASFSGGVSTYACLMSGFIKTKCWPQALMLFEDIVKEPFEPNVIIYNAAITAFTNLGQMDKAEETYAKCVTAVERDIVTFTVITASRAVSGEWWKVYWMYHMDVLPQKRPDIVFLFSLFESLWYTGSVLSQLSAVMIYAEARASKYLFEVPDYHSGPAELTVSSSTVASCELYTFTWMSKIRDVVRRQNSVLPSMCISLWKQCRSFAHRFWLVLHTRMAAKGCPCTSEDTQSPVLSLVWTGPAITDWLLSDASAFLDVFTPSMPLANQMCAMQHPGPSPRQALEVAMRQEERLHEELKITAARMKDFEETHRVNVNALPEDYFLQRPSAFKELRSMAANSCCKVTDWYNGLSILDWLMSTDDESLKSSLMDDIAASIVTCATLCTADPAEALSSMPTLSPEKISLCTGLAAKIRIKLNSVETDEATTAIPQALEVEDDVQPSSMYSPAANQPDLLSQYSQSSLEHSHLHPASASTSSLNKSRSTNVMAGQPYSNQLPQREKGRPVSAGSPLSINGPTPAQRAWSDAWPLNSVHPETIPCSVVGELGSSSGIWTAAGAPSPDMQLVNDSLQQVGLPTSADPSLCVMSTSEGPMHVQYASPYACLLLILDRLKDGSTNCNAQASTLAHNVIQMCIWQPVSLMIRPWELAAVVYACCQTACGSGWGHARCLTSLFGLSPDMLAKSKGQVALIQELITSATGLQVHHNLLHPTVHAKSSSRHHQHRRAPKNRPETVNHASATNPYEARRRGPSEISRQQNAQHWLQSTQPTSQQQQRKPAAHLAMLYAGRSVTIPPASPLSHQDRHLGSNPPSISSSVHHLPHPPQRLSQNLDRRPISQPPRASSIRRALPQQHAYMPQQRVPQSGQPSVTTLTWPPYSYPDNQSVEANFLMSISAGVNQVAQPPASSFSHSTGLDSHAHWDSSDQAFVAALIRSQQLQQQQIQLSDQQRQLVEHHDASMLQQTAALRLTDPWAGPEHRFQHPVDVLRSSTVPQLPPSYMSSTSPSTSSRLLNTQATLSQYSDTEWTWPPARR